MQDIYFTSDTHYNHGNICRGVSNWLNKDGCRDFDTLKEMNDAIVENINTIVREDDILFHLGDWSFGGFGSIIDFRKKLRCQNIYLTFGNHDHHIERNKEGVQGYFKNCRDRREISVEGQKIVLSHYAMRVWNKSHRGYWQLYGHSHGSLPGIGKQMDVGIDTHPEFRPYHFEEIKQIMDTKKINYVDGHGRGMDENG